MILAISRLVLDTRFAGSEGIGGVRGIVMQLLGQIERRMEEPDAGLWELRNTTKLHSFTLLANWAGAMRAVEIANVLGDDEMRSRAHRAADECRRLLETRCWDDERGVLTQAADQTNLDAAMLMATHFHFWDPGDPRAASHVEAVRRELQVGKLLRRYDVKDDFGAQEAAFTVCSFWLVEALAHVGRKDEAIELFEYLVSQNNGLGLFSEDIMPGTGELTGNFPQTVLARRGHQRGVPPVAGLGLTANCGDADPTGRAAGHRHDLPLHLRARGVRAPGRSGERFRHRAARGSLR